MKKTGESNMKLKAAPQQLACDGKDQIVRRDKVFSLVRDLSRPRVLRENGKTVIPYVEHPDDLRAHLWLARAFLHGDKEDRKLANEMIASVEFKHACHFCGAASAVLLCAEKSRLEPAAVANLERFLQSNISDWMTADYAFVGANDNAPLGCLLALVLGGEYMGNPDLVDFSRERLSQLDHILDLRGYINECNSPTYSGISLMYLAELAEYAQDETIRRMALRAEQRVWQETLLHFHPILRQQVGPFSRAYEDDNANQCSIFMMVLYAALGTVSPFNPMNMLFPPPAGTFGHGPWDFQHRSLAAAAAPIYHPPAKLAETLLKRKLPCDSIGNNEFMGGWDVPGGETTVNLHLEENYGLGTFGSRLWIGQTTPLHLLYRRHHVNAAAPITEHLAAQRTVFTRLLISDRFDGMDDRASNIVKDVSRECGSSCTVQSGGTALLGYVPVCKQDTIRTVRASVILPLHHSRPDEVRFGEQKVSGFSGAYTGFDWCFIRDGDIYLGIHPLVSRQQNALLCSTKFADGGKYGLISFYNLCSFHPEPLSREELRSLGNGMVLEVGTAKKWGSFPKFINALRKARIVNQQRGTERSLFYERDGVELELIYDFAQLNLRRSAVNRKLVNASVKLETTPALDLIG
ncbi:MAG: hypothetical protein WC637_09990 [Victivallales bacterium]|jgi:hypothetical protein